MKARSVVDVGPGAVLRRLDTVPPLTIRRIRSVAAECALCLVGTAAGPLPGDDWELSVTVEGARANLCASGATVAQGSGGSSRLQTTVTLKAGAELVADPGPLIVCTGAEVDVGQDIVMDADCTLRWDELLVLGRSGDPEPGRVRLRWDVERDGHALLRQSIDLADPWLRSWSGMSAGHRVLASTLLVSPGLTASTVVAGPYAVAQHVAEDAVLITVLGDSAADVIEQRDELVHPHLRAPDRGRRSASLR